MSKRIHKHVCNRYCQRTKHRKVRVFANAVEALTEAAWAILADGKPPVPEDAEGWVVLRAAARAALYMKQSMAADVESTFKSC